VPSDRDPQRPHDAVVSRSEILGEDESGPQLVLSPISEPLRLPLRAQSADAECACDRGSACDGADAECAGVEVSVRVSGHRVGSLFYLRRTVNILCLTIIDIRTTPVLWNG
jgi:hypothetical protein